MSFNVITEVWKVKENSYEEKWQNNRTVPFDSIHQLHRCWFSHLTTFSHITNKTLCIILVTVGTHKEFETMLAFQIFKKAHNTITCNYYTFLEIIFVSTKFDYYFHVPLEFGKFFFLVLLSRQNILFMHQMNYSG